MGISKVGVRGKDGKQRAESGYVYTIYYVGTVLVRVFVRVRSWAGWHGMAGPFKFPGLDDERPGCSGISLRLTARVAQASSAAYMLTPLGRFPLITVDSLDES